MAKTNVEYDAEVIQKFAADLYKRARSITASYAVGAGLIALVAAVMFSGGDNVGLNVIILTVVGALAGYSIGQSKAFQLKLDAQTALAQVQIELNTRAQEGQSQT